MRSWLFVPGDSEKKLAKIAGCGADAVILDLEDSVGPNAKEAARDTVRIWLSSRPDGGPAAYVRVNPLDLGALEDLVAVMPGAPDGIVLPKTRRAADVDRLGHWLEAFEAAEGRKIGVTRILPIVTETPEGALRVAEFAAGGRPRLAGLTWGAEDLAAALGASTNRGADGDWALTFRLARANVLLAAHAAGIAAIDTLHADFRDLDGLSRTSAVAEAEGWAGRLAIHPAQVAPINAAFTPPEAAVAEARRVIEAFAAAPGAGVVALGGRMLDIPHLRQAEKVLQRARRAAAREG